MARPINARYHFDVRYTAFYPVLYKNRTPQTDRQTPEPASKGKVWQIDGLSCSFFVGYALFVQSDRYISLIQLLLLAALGLSALLNGAYEEKPIQSFQFYQPLT